MQLSNGFGGWLGRVVISSDKLPERGSVFGRVGDSFDFVLFGSAIEIICIQHQTGSPSFSSPTFPLVAFLPTAQSRSPAP